MNIIPVKFSELDVKPTLNGTEIVPGIDDSGNIALTTESIKEYVDSTAGDNDKYYLQTFSDSISVVVQHNLNKKPAVTIIDSAGDQVVAEVTYDTVNQLTLDFSASFSGTVTCN